MVRLNMLYYTREALDCTQCKKGQYTLGLRCEYDKHRREIDCVLVYKLVA